MARRVVVDNNTYKSVSAAWRELSPGDLPLVTVFWRLKHGWDPDHALKTGPVDPTQRRLWKVQRQ